MTNLAEYRHRSGVVLPVPDTWELLTRPDAVVAAREQPRGPELFRANVVVTLTGRLDPPPAVPAECLTDYLLLDEDADGGRGHRLAQHRADGPGDTTFGSVTIEQWTRVAGGRVATLTASCATARYPAHADLFASIGDGFRLSTPDSS